MSSVAPVHPSEIAPSVEDVRVTGGTRWQDEPDTVEACAFNAGVLLQSMGESCIARVRGWVKQGERDGITHMGKHASYRGILAVLETPGLTVKPIARQKSWSDAEVEDA